ncbi:hypothetical protein M0R45_015755 [Rubus argutus]|uniref:Uncharacterized protein n=1 Tax=Rubus argutus TaxID=59490 RepID=A0AAW1XQ61_RUBAR
MGSAWTARWLELVADCGGDVLVWALLLVMRRELQQRLCFVMVDDEFGCRDSIGGSLGFEWRIWNLRRAMVLWVQIWVVGESEHDGVGFGVWAPRFVCDLVRAELVTGMVVIWRWIEWVG